MFRELELANWAQIIGIIAFFVSLAVFLFFVIGAIRMPKNKVDHDASLPLAEEKPEKRP